MSVKKNLRKRVNHKIIKIHRSSRYSDRIVITLDNKNVFRIPEDVFVLKPLRVGDFISKTEIKKYDKKMRLQEAKDTAFKFLSFRMRSQSEMRKKLKDKSFLEHEINYAIDLLLKYNYLNDKEFAFSFAKEKIKLKKIGPKLLSFELTRRGISEEISVQVIEECYNDNSIYKLIRHHLEKKKINKKSKLDIKKKKKLTDFLLRKGFNWQAISVVYNDWGIL